MNNVIWSIVPKRTFVSIQILKLRTHAAVLAFNKGNMGIVDVFQILNVNPGKFCVESLKKLDQERIDRAAVAAQEYTKDGIERKG